MLNVNSRLFKISIIPGLLAVLFLAYIFVGTGNKTDNSIKSLEKKNLTGYENATSGSEGNAAKNEISYDRLGGNDESTADTAEEDTKTQDASFSATDSGIADSYEATSVTDKSVSSVYNLILDQRKVIRNASLSIEVESFKTAYAKLNNLIMGIGYIQETNISNEKIETGEETRLISSGTIVLRIDKDKFDSVLGKLTGLGTVMNQSITSNDVTEQYFDVESRKKLLLYEEERLLVYLKKTTDPDSIFKYESRLTEIRHEIESYTGQLKKWENLVQLSTITIYMNEKMPDNIKPNEEGYLTRLFRVFAGSLKGVAEFLGDFIIFVVAALPVLIIIFVFGIAGIFVSKKLKRMFISYKQKQNKAD